MFSIKNVDKKKLPYNTQNPFSLKVHFMNTLLKKLSFFESDVIIKSLFFKNVENSVITKPKSYVLLCENSFIRNVICH